MPDPAQGPSGVRQVSAMWMGLMSSAAGALTLRCSFTHRASVDARTYAVFACVQEVSYSAVHTPCLPGTCFQVG